MRFEFCLPTLGKAVPAGAEWFHEIKYDGYRLRLERDGDRMRLITKGGYDWAKRFPWIVEAALKNRQKQFVIDGEAVVLGVDGISDFSALHSGRHNTEVQLCAFDVLAMDCEDLRELPLSMRKANLERLLRGRPDGIFINPFETGAIGPGLFHAACRMGLEGLVSKRSDRPYRGRAVEGLAEGEEPKPPRHSARQGSLRVNRIRIIRHEAVPQCGSFEVRFPDGRPSKFFYWDDVPGRRMRREILDSTTAEEQAKALARAEQEGQDMESGRDRAEGETMRNGDC